MSSKSTTGVKADASPDDHQRADQASDAFMVGIDNDNREHYYSRIRDCVTVIDDNEHETQPLDGRPPKVWMAFVKQELCGWDEKNVYSGSTVEHFVDQLDDGVTPEEGGN